MKSTPPTLPRCAGIDHGSRIDLINDVAEYLYNETASFHYNNIGATLAYLLWAIAAGTSIDVNDTERTTVNILKTNPELWLRVKEFVTNENDNGRT
jgi:hypothetical protein